MHGRVRLLLSEELWRSGRVFIADKGSIHTGVPAEERGRAKREDEKKEDKIEDPERNLKSS
jgi:hypothetical protein